MTKIKHSEFESDFDDNSTALVDVEVEMDRSELKRENRIEKLLYKHLPDEDMSLEYMLNNSIVEVIESMNDNLISIELYTDYL